MGISYKVGTFQGRGAGTGTQDITDVGFQPKALIIFKNLTISDDAFVANAYFFIGFSDGTNDAVATMHIADAQATSYTYSNLYNDAIINIVDGSGSQNVASVSTFLSNGFRLNWTVNNWDSNYYSYIAIGGDDITNVKVGTQTIGTTTTGSKGYTGVGFVPDFLLTGITGFLPGAGAYTMNTSSETNAGLGIGCAKSSSARWTNCSVSENGRTRADAWKNQRGDKCFLYLDNTTGARLLEADFVSFDSDGFTFNYTTNTTANNQNGVFTYLAIKGGVWDVGYFQSPATNTTVQTNTTAGSGNTLKGVFISDVKSNVITSTTIDAAGDLEIGASDGTTPQVSTYSEIDNADPSVTAGISSSTYICEQITANATHTSSTIVGRATVSFAQNSFTTSWSSTDGTQRYIPYFALSEAGEAAAVAEEVYQSYGNIHQNFDSNKNAIFG